jgi:hypothetical protein
MLISILHPARKPNEQARATNEPSRANLFAHFVSLVELARYLNEPDQVEPSLAELAQRPALIMTMYVQFPLNSYDHSSRQ